MKLLLQETLCSNQTKPYMQFLHHLFNGIKVVCYLVLQLRLIEFHCNASLDLARYYKTRLTKVMSFIYNDFAANTEVHKVAEKKAMS